VDEQASISRLLPAFALDLLSAADTERVRAALAGSPSLRRELDELQAEIGDWTEEGAHPSREQLADAVAGRLGGGRVREVVRHLLACADCRLEASIEAAARRTGRVALRRIPWRPAAAAAIVLCAGWIGLRIGERRATEGAGGALVFEPVELRALRGDAERTLVHLPEIDGAGIELRLETRMDTNGASWELVDEAGATVMQGRFPAAGPAAAWHVSTILVPTAVLRPGEHRFRVRSADGADQRTWLISVVDVPGGATPDLKERAR
jgi:hypothetical protein